MNFENHEELLYMMEQEELPDPIETSTHHEMKQRMKEKQLQILAWKEQQQMEKFMLEEDPEDQRVMERVYMLTSLRIHANEAVVQKIFDTYFAKHFVTKNTTANALDVRNQKFIHFRIQCLWIHIRESLRTFPNYLDPSIEQALIQSLQPIIGLDWKQVSKEQSEQLEDQALAALFKLKREMKTKKVMENYGNVQDALNLVLRKIEQNQPLTEAELLNIKDWSRNVEDEQEVITRRLLYSMTYYKLTGNPSDTFHQEYFQYCNDHDRLYYRLIQSIRKNVDPYDLKRNPFKKQSYEKMEKKMVSFSNNLDGIHAVHQDLEKLTQQHDGILKDYNVDRYLLRMLFPDWMDPVQQPDWKQKIMRRNYHDTKTNV